MRCDEQPWGTGFERSRLSASHGPRNAQDLRRNLGSGTITAYFPDGTQTTPTISTGNYLFAIAVAPSGKIYALTFGPLSGPHSNGTVASYNSDGAKTTPTVTIKERGYHEPVGIAVDGGGKIYVLSSVHNGTRGMVTTYKPDGSRATPVFRTGADSSNIAIDRNGKRGSGTVMTTPLNEEYFDGYDNEGNLFADGFADSFALIELPKGSSTFQTITTSNTVEFPGSVQWDGKYVTVTDQEANAMYQYTISGTKATLRGTVSLKGSADCAQTWIATGVVFCADAGLYGAEVFKYPAGGSPIAILSGNFDLPLGAVAAKE
jgi:hypothetical protein